MYDDYGTTEDRRYEPSRTEVIEALIESGQHAQAAAMLLHEDLLYTAHLSPGDVTAINGALRPRGMTLVEDGRWMFVVDLGDVVNHETEVS